MTGEQDAPPARGLVAFRLAIGLAQGVALYLLYSAFDAKVWPATSGYLFAPLALAAFYVPLIAIQGAGNLRAATLALWIATAAAVVAAFAWYDIWRAWPVEYGWQNGAAIVEPHVLPSFGLVFYLAIALFVAHALVTGADADRRAVARYPTYFDTAWKLGLQIALSFIFVCLFWAILWLGAELFELIKLDFFKTLIEHQWFSIPATALATAAALHVTDVRGGMVRGTRTLVLALLAWLLPLMALIAAGFLASLPFTGLAPLWATRHAGALLLAAAAILVMLVNAAYQDGPAERKAPLVFEIAIRLACALLVPTVALAAYALWLRVSQYGWSVDRVAAAAITLVAASYALGYAAGAALPGARLIERWNVVTAFLILGVLGTVFSPIADPARIAVTSQMARLDDRKIDPAQFDVHYLRNEGGRFGYAAIQRLSKSGIPSLREQAKNELRPPQIFDAGSQPKVATAASRASDIVVYPRGAKLPQSFLDQDWHAMPIEAAVSAYIPDCLRLAAHPCDAFLVDLDGDGQDEILLFVESTYGGTGLVIRQGADGKWAMSASVTLPSCGAGLDALKAGTFKLAAHPFKDLVMGGVVWETNTLANQSACKR
jgi:Domain of unknown function (DUF4153)